MNFTTFSAKVKHFDIFLFLTLFIWGSYFTYIWLHMLYYNANGDLVAGWINVWGDFPAHFAYSAPFAYRSPLNWLNVNPLFINSKFNYPFLSDAISGILVNLGLDISKAFVLPSILFSFLFLFSFYRLAYQLVKNSLGAFLSVSIFLLGGGLGFIHFINNDLINFLNTFVLTRQYTQMDDLHIKWINPVTSELIPQRSFLLALPLVLFILFNLNKLCVKSFKIYKSPLQHDFRIDYVYLILLGLLSGMLPIIHMHSFIALFIFCVFLFLYNVKSYKKLLLFGVFTAVPAVVLYFTFFYKQIDTKAFIEYFPGWMANSKEFNKPLINFWWWNFGLFLPLSIISYFYLKLYKNYIYTAAIFIFIICHLYKFQPWAWDNSKLLTYWYLIFSIAISKFIMALLPFKKGRLPKGRLLIKWLYKAVSVKVITFLIIGLTFSGFLDLINLSNYKKNSYTISSRVDLLVAREINRIINDKDVVLSSTNHTNLIVNYTRAQVIMGYAGWLWSYGINFGPTLDDVYSMYRNPQVSKELFRKYNVKYVFISNAERSEYTPDEIYFEQNAKLVYDQNGYRLFKIFLD